MKYSLSHPISRFTITGKTEPSHQCNDYCALCDIDWLLESASIKMNISYNVTIETFSGMIKITFDNVAISGFLQLDYYHELGDETEVVVVTSKELTLKVHEDLDIRSNVPVDAEIIIDLNTFTAEIIFI